MGGSSSTPVTAEAPVKQIEVDESSGLSIFKIHGQTAALSAVLFAALFAAFIAITCILWRRTRSRRAHRHDHAHTPFHVPHFSPHNPFPLQTFQPFQPVQPYSPPSYNMPQMYISPEMLSIIAQRHPRTTFDSNRFTEVCDVSSEGRRNNARHSGPRGRVAPDASVDTRQTDDAIVRMDERV